MRPQQTRNSILASCLVGTTTRVAAVLLAFAGGVPAAADAARDEQHKKLDFLVGVWSTSHAVPAGDGEARIVLGEAVIEWVVGKSWLRHEFEAEFPGRGRVFMTNMMNYSLTKKMYNFYMFDHFGGEAGQFYGDWRVSNEIVLTAMFAEEDGTTSYQRFTLTPVSADEIRFNRAFSDDGDNYHFELEGVYTRKKE